MWVVFLIVFFLIILVGCRKEAGVLDVPTLPPDEFLPREVRVGDRNIRYRIFTPHWVAASKLPVDNSRKMVRALTDAGNDSVNYSKLAGVGHYSPDSAFGEPKLFEWLAGQRTNRDK